MRGSVGIVIWPLRKCHAGGQEGPNCSDMDKTATDTIALINGRARHFMDGRATRFFWSRKGFTIIFILAAIGLASVVSKAIYSTLNLFR